MKRFKLLLGTVLAAASMNVHAQEEKFSYEDIFNLEYATGPRITPNGEAVVYERRSMDIMTDGMRSNIWMVNLDGTEHRPLLSGKAQYRMPRFSPDGTRMAYVSSVEGKNQIYVRWLDSGETARVTDLQYGPGNLSWSPDGKSIAFTMFVPKKNKPLFTLPAKPKGAKWAGNAKVIDKVTYRADGQGFLPSGYTQVFVVPADGGTPRQITKGEFNNGGSLAWMPDSGSIIFSANRTENWELNPREADLYRVDINSGDLAQLTTRSGPDGNPVISPDGSKIAFTSFEDKKLSHQNAALHIMNVDGSGVQEITTLLDRNIQGVQWAPDSQGIYYSYDNEGKRLVGYATLAGGSRILTNAVGGTTLGRPYTSGDFRAVGDGRVVFTRSETDRPADLAVVDRIGRVTSLTNLNGDILSGKGMATVEEFTVQSSLDGLTVQGWIAKPANFDPNKKYPLILEIHGGPHAAYGPQFSAEVQLYAAAGYVVLWTNPRGSTSYGEEFANEIHHKYPASDYNDLMDSVDGLIASGMVDEDKLYVTGGSGGGVLTSWIVGKTKRFKAAVVAKPVINWASFVLTADFSPFFTQYWFPDMPWNIPTHYWERSPLSLVGNVTTPTMLLTGENDYRTPMSETEQYYQALKLQGVDTVMVRVPGVGHGIAAKPSNLAQKVGNILAWFEKYKD
ncbi:S9 family peptidase [Kordiimonas sp. SCSIO 12603]|uniref:alpha/beta hydrolase family protein n=1 Tax=Kordiimonas sp. SCSIO 12603 TaxID=2829596 RepID=UPI002106D83C|nr:S9 family peptidase [Kordiimonas sp. SCSIO 12603]UTW58615.1 S9 family peptidase [Kordiimonas sp. SCSIO 12603]